MPIDRRTRASTGRRQTSRLAPRFACGSQGGMSVATEPIRERARSRRSGPEHGGSSRTPCDEKRPGDPKGDRRVLILELIENVQVLVDVEARKLPRNRPQIRQQGLDVAYMHAPMPYLMFLEVQPSALDRGRAQIDHVGAAG